MPESRAEAATRHRRVAGVHVAVDAVGMRHFSGGPLVLLDLLDALQACEDVRFGTVFASPTRDFQLPTLTKIRVVECSQADGSRADLLRWVTRDLNRACIQRGADGLISLNALALTQIPTIVLFQQQLMFSAEAVRLMPARFRMRLALLRVLARRACRRASWVIAQAPHVAESLRNNFDLDTSRIRVLRPAVRWARTEPTTLELPPNLLTYIGSDEPYKSLETLLLALPSLRSSRPSLELAVTLTSGSRASGVPGVRCLGLLPRQHVHFLLSRASALVMPSLAETVGMPLLEAMDVGCPIVAADLPYARDVCGDAALYFIPRDPASCSSVCRKVLDDPDLRRKLVAAGFERARVFRAEEPYSRLAQLAADTFGGIE